MIDYSKLVPVAEMKGEDDDETSLLKKEFQSATDFVRGFNWCKSIDKSFFGLGVGGVVSVFYFEITPNVEGVDQAIWVITGDLPPLYLPQDVGRNPALALAEYIAIVRDWTRAAIKQEISDRHPPLGLAFTIENGRRLKKKLDFIEVEILRFYASDLDEVGH
jgi:hypothetical protein